MKYILIIFFCFSLFSCGITEKKTEIFILPEKKLLQNPEFKSSLEEGAIKKYLDSFSLKEKLAQLFIINLEGSQEYTKKFDYNETLCPSGFIFFSYNIAKTPEQILHFNYSIQEYYKNSIPPFLAIDLEGGFVNRLQSIISPLPSPGDIPKLFSLQEVEIFYETIAKQTKVLGFSLNLAPIVEPIWEENAQFLQNRSFGSFDIAQKYSKAFIQAFNNQNILCSLKHFPGNANIDPHLSLPVIALSYNDLEKKMLLPFYEVLKDKKKHNAILLSHAILPALSNTPASLSPEIIALLKKDFNYQGLIITDDIFMKALEKYTIDEYDAIFQAIEAGAHIILSSKKIFVSFLPLLEKRYLSEPDFKKQVDIALFKIIQAKLETNLLHYRFTNIWGKTIVIEQKAKNENAFLEAENVFTIANERGKELYFDAVQSKKTLEGK